MLQRVSERLLLRLGPHYILVMMCVTRVCASLGGLGLLYYVDLSLKLPHPVRRHFEVVSLVLVAVAVIVTVFLALWETRRLREVIGRIRAALPVDGALGREAGREAVVFLNRHHRMEAWLVPAITLVPLLAYLRMVDQASTAMLINVSLAALMATALVLLATYFLIGACMRPVIAYLPRRGVAIEFDSLPVSKLRGRMNVSFAMITLTTALMIGILANQRASDMLAHPESQHQAVNNLRQHTTYITVVAVMIGLVFSTVLAQSVADRVGELVDSMKRVQAGDLSARLTPTGNDEIDIVTRQFNEMVDQLDRNDHTIRDLNANLEKTVRYRTRQLSKKKRELQASLRRLQGTQSQMMQMAHLAGMTEIATGVLHNVGNVLNNVNISTTVLGERLRQLRIDGLTKTVSLLDEHADDLEAFLAKDRRGRQVVEYLGRLANTLAADQQELINEVGFLADKVQHIRNIIVAEQSYAKRASFKELCQLASLVEDVLLMRGHSLQKERIEVVREFDALPPLVLERSKLLQVVENLIKNAIESIVCYGGEKRRIHIRIQQLADDRVRLAVTDSGGGIDPEHAGRIFNFGFTTKKSGNGFGLHSAANAMNEMGGTISAQSDGAGCGATFALEIPMMTEAADEPRTPEQEQVPQTV